MNNLCSTCLQAASRAALTMTIGAMISTAAFAQTETQPISLDPADGRDAQLQVQSLDGKMLPRLPANFHRFGGVEGGRTSDIHKLTLRFAESVKLTGISSKSKEFRVEQGSSCVEGRAYEAKSTCSLLVTFTPRGPGNRLGGLSISHSGSARPMFVGLNGEGYASVATFTPSSISTLAGTYIAGKGLLSSTTNLSVDGGDILYVPDTGNNLLREFDSSATETDLTPYDAPPISLAVDSFGFVYTLNGASSSGDYLSLFTPFGNQGNYGYPTEYASCTPSAPCPLGSTGLLSPKSLSIDANNNLFLAEQNYGGAEMPVGGQASGLVGDFSLWYLSDQYVYSGDFGPVTAVDASDNFYSFYTHAAPLICYITSEPAYTAEGGSTPLITRAVGGSKCGFSGDGGLARGAEISDEVGQITFDAAGDLYFTDEANQRVRRVDSATGIITTIAGTGVAGYAGDGGAATLATLNNPTGLAVDSQGQVYIVSSSSGTAQVVREIGTQGHLSMGTLAVGTTSAVKTVELTNTGNTSLNMSRVALTSGNTGDFALNTNATTCNFAAALIPGKSCVIGFTFTPTAAGLRSAIFSVYDDTVAGVNTVYVAGIGATTATLAPATLTFSSTAVGSSSAAQTATLKNTGSGALAISSIALAGAHPASYSKTTTCGATLASGASCTISVTFAPTASGTLTASLTVSDNALTPTQTINLTGTGTSAAVKHAALTTPAPGSTLPGSKVMLSWTPATDAAIYTLELGTKGAGSNNLYSSGHMSRTSVLVKNLPTNGETIYARLAAIGKGSPVVADYVFKAAH